jgi:hypothetical protein
MKSDKANQNESIICLTAPSSKAAVETWQYMINRLTVLNFTSSSDQ